MRPPTKPRPFVKWVGGKRQIIEILKENLPKNFDTYIEPFVGGGALFFELLPRKAVINDLNEELINAYRTIKEYPHQLVEDLKKHKNEEEYFYDIRSSNPENLNQIERASRFIYLNKTCFNGLYRENSKGQFNVPFGKYKSPRIVDKENILAISEYLNTADVTISNEDYKETVKSAKRGDFIYLDPPYYPLNKNSSFTKYTKYDFTEEDHVELFEEFVKLDTKGCHVMLSNSNTPFIKDLYREYEIIEITTNRYINSKADGRKLSAKEIIVKNY